MREWWIENKSIESDRVSFDAIRSVRPVIETCYVDVIEKSAYLALEADLENQMIKSDEEYRKLQHIHELTLAELANYRRTSQENGEAYAACRAELEQVKKWLDGFKQSYHQELRDKKDALDQLTAANERTKGLVSDVERIMRDPVYTSQIAIAAWDQALLKYKGEDGE